MRNSGKLIQWINKNNEQCHGIAYDMSQTPAFASVNKIAYVKTDAQFQPIVNDKGGHIVGLVDIKKVKI